MEKIDFVSLYQFDEIYSIKEIECGQSGTSEFSGPSDQSDSVKTEEHEKIIGNEEWLILGIEADRKSVQAIFTSQPFNFTPDKFIFEEASTWSIEVIRDFVKKSTATKMVFLGQTFEFLNLKPEPIQRANKFYLYFPQTLSSLKDTEKQTKILFWNQLKKML